MARPASLTPEQRRVVEQLKAAPSWNRASPKVRKALLEAAAVESNFSTPNQANSDRDSEGALQQRPSQGWGPTSESNTTDAEQFLRRAIPLARKYGSAGALAQAVQRSAFPDRYNQRSGIASLLLGSSAPRTGGGATASAASAGGTTRTTTTTTPGVDNSRQRALVALNFLGNKSADVLDFASQIKQLQDIPGTTETQTTRTPGSSGSSAQTPAGGDSVAGGLAAMAAKRADVIDRQTLPYRWGGGHGGQTKISDPVPLDCSGAVSKVLGINPRVSGEFGKWGRPGDGGNRGVTIYSNGHHVLMKINGHFFGTSGSNPGGGAGWIPQGAISSGYLKGFTARHSAR